MFGANEEMVGVVGDLIDDLSIGLGVPGCDNGLAAGSLLGSRKDFGVILSFISGVAKEGMGVLPLVIRSMVLLSGGKIWVSSKARSSGPLPFLLCLETEGVSKASPEVADVFRLPVGLRRRVK